MNVTTISRCPSCGQDVKHAGGDQGIYDLWNSGMPVTTIARMLETTSSKISEALQRVSLNKEAERANGS